MVVDHQAAELKIVFQRKLNPQDCFSTINILVDIFNSTWFPNGGVCSRIVPPQPRLWLKWASQRTCWAAWEAGGELNNGWSEYKIMLLTTFISVKWISHHILRWARICSPELCRGWLLLTGTWSWWTLNGQFPSWQDQLDHDQPPDGEGEGEPDGDGVDHHREVGMEQQEDSPPKWVLKQVTKLHWETEWRKRKGNGK